MSAPLHTTGWGPFRLRGEARRLAAAEESARLTLANAEECRLAADRAIVRIAARADAADAVIARVRAMHGAQRCQQCVKVDKYGACETIRALHP